MDLSGQNSISIILKKLEKILVLLFIEDPIDILEVDNTAVRLEQVENLKRLKEGRNEEAKRWNPSCTMCP